MLAAIPASWRSRAVTCWVGARNPHAATWVDSNVALMRELGRLAATWREGRAGRRLVRPERARSLLREREA
jgi:hypothetical protein